MKKSKTFIKRLVCLTVTVAMMLSCSIFTYAAEGTSDIGSVSENLTEVETAGDNAAEDISCDQTTDAADVYDESGMKVQDSVTYSDESAGAPPASFDIYIQVGDDTAESDRYKIASITGQQMRLWATSGTLKFSAQSNSVTAGRVVKEWIPLTKFPELLSEVTGYKVCYDTNDYFIMGEDLTKAEDMQNRSRKDQTGNWYSYKSMVETKRYYYPDWDSGSTSGAKEVPSVITIKSYGGGSGMSDEMLDMYGSSADYLWAYVVNYGQTNLNEYNYQYFYYGQKEASFRYVKTDAMNETISSILTSKISEAAKYLENTVIDTDSTNVAQGTYWATAAVYNAFKAAYDTAVEASTKEGATNGEGFDAMTNLADAIDTFAAARTPGAKSGYFWYDKDAKEYTITSSDQLWELCTIVNGEATDETSQKTIAQDSFEGKTIYLACDVDANESRAHIGTSEYEFKGTFDGQGHTISNLKITSSNDAYSRSGYFMALFGNIGSTGVVKNLTVKGVSGGEKITDYVGGLCAKNSGTIENCTSYIDVNATASNMAGGIAAYNYGTITNCKNYGSVEGKSYAGGIVGNNTRSITNCANSGNVSGATNVGGVAGFSTGTMTQVANHGEISVSAADETNYIGGITGKNTSGTISYCYNDGHISGNAADNAGGIAGNSAAGTTVKYGFNAGTLKFSETAEGDKFEYTGALFGSFNGTAESLLWLNTDTNDNTANYVGASETGIASNSGTLTSVEAVTASELRAEDILTKLNIGGQTAFKESCGHPVLSFEEAKAHTEVEDKGKEPTCTEPGEYSGYHCSVCGLVIKEKSPAPATGHTEVKDEAVAATCSSTGLTEGSHCSVCKEVIVKQEVVKAKGHTIVTDKAIAATTTKTGLTEGSHCGVCGLVIKKQEVIPKLVADGWHNIGGKYYFYKNNEVQKGWIANNDKKYYTDPTTGVRVEGLKKISGFWYYFDSFDGEMLTGLQKTNGYWRYFDPSNGKMLTGLQKTNGYWRYFDGSNGRMLTGLQKTNGYWRYFDASNGRMLTGLQKTNGYWRYFDASNGRMLTGFQKVNGYTRYFNTSNGRMLTGWQTIGGKKYYFDSNGRMVTGKKTISGKTYTFNSSGVWVK